MNGHVKTNSRPNKAFHWIAQETGIQVNFP